MANISKNKNISAVLVPVVVGICSPSLGEGFFVIMVKWKRLRLPKNVCR